MCVFSNILSQVGYRIAKLVAEYRAEEFSSAVVPYVALKEVAMEYDLSESDRELNFPDIICARWFYYEKLSVLL